MTKMDQVVADRLKILRKMRGKSQKDVALPLGVSFQQYQKYEIGHNRISASTLYKLSKILSVDLNDFFKDIDQNAYRENVTIANTNFPNLNKDTFELLNLFYKIENTDLRKSLIKLINSYIKKNGA